MPGIAGIVGSGIQVRVQRMLDKMAHRGQAGHAVFEIDGATLGQIGAEGASISLPSPDHAEQVCDAAGPGHLAWAQVVDQQLMLWRDPLGVAPLYYGRTYDGALCFASEMKALLEVTRDVHELPPGHLYDGAQLSAYSRLALQPLLIDTPEHIAQELAAAFEQWGEAMFGAWRNWRVAIRGSGFKRAGSAGATARQPATHFCGGPAGRARLGICAGRGTLH